MLTNSRFSQPVGIRRVCIKVCKLWYFILIFASIAATAESKKADVFYGGFAFSGKADDVEKNFPIASSLNKLMVKETPYLAWLSREFFLKNKDRFSRMNLQFGLARKEDSSLVLALALTDEKILREEFSDFHKLVIQLGFELLVLNFKNQEVVCSQPIYLEFIDAGKEPFDDAALRMRMKSMLEGTIPSCSRQFWIKPIGCNLAPKTNPRYKFVRSPFARKLCRFCRRLFVRPQMLMPKWSRTNLAPFSHPKQA